MAMAIADVALAALAAFGIDALLARAVRGLRRLRMRPRAVRGLPVSAGALSAGCPSRYSARRRSRGYDCDRRRAALAALQGVGARSAYGPRSSFAVCSRSALIEIGNSTGFDYVHVEDKASLVEAAPLPDHHRTSPDFSNPEIGSDRVSYAYDDLVFNFGDWYGIPSLAGFLPSAPEAIVAARTLESPHPRSLRCALLDRRTEAGGCRPGSVRAIPRAGESGSGQPHCRAHG